MGKVNVIIVDATGNKEQKVGLPDDIKTGVIMVKLVEKIKLPSVGPDGNPISYKFIHKVSGRQLLEMQTLAEAGVKDGTFCASSRKLRRAKPWQRKQKSSFPLRISAKIAIAACG